jgi:hypothetical protein
MSTKGLIVLWLLGAIAIFGIGLLCAHIMYTLALKDFAYEPADYSTSTLKVKEVPKGTLQTDQYTPIQPAVNPIGKEL